MNVNGKVGILFNQPIMMPPVVNTSLWNKVFKLKVVSNDQESEYFGSFSEKSKERML